MIEPACSVVFFKADLENVADDWQLHFLTSIRKRKISNMSKSGTGSKYENKVEQLEARKIICCSR